MKVKVWVNKVGKAVRKFWVGIPFGPIWQNFANVATALGLIWAIFTYNKSQVENVQKDAANLRELARIQKKDSLQLSLLNAQYLAALKEKDWARYKDKILIEYARRNLDTISLTSRKALHADIDANRQYLNAFNEVYKNIIELQGQQTRLQERAFTLQERINAPLLELDSLNLSRTTYYFQGKELLIKLEGTFRIFNLGLVATRDLKAELLSLSYGQQDFSSVTDTASLVKSNGLFENSIHWTNTGIAAGKSKLVPFSCFISLPLLELPKLIRSKLITVVSAKSDPRENNSQIYSSAFEIFMFKKKGTDYAHEVFSRPTFSEYELRFLEKQSTLLRVESLDKYSNSRAFDRDINRLTDEIERSNERVKLQKKIYEDVKKSLIK